MSEGSKPVFVHSDIGRSILIAKRMGAQIDPRDLRQSFLDFLAVQAGGREDQLLFPAFNYGYGASRRFDMAADEVQVGAFPEWVRHQTRFTRTPIPFFSFLAQMDLELSTKGTINPFSAASGFQWLLDHGADILMCGTNLASMTFIHFVEESCGKPLYRYDKAFPGTIVFPDGCVEACAFSMHVRPNGANLDYDFPRLEADLASAGILTVEDPWFSRLNSGALFDFWSRKLADDPFYLLNDASRTFFRTATNNGDRRVEQKDFEDV